MTTAKRYTEIDEGIGAIRSRIRELEAALRDESLAAQRVIWETAANAEDRDPQGLAAELAHLSERHAQSLRDLAALNGAMLALGTVSTLAESVESRFRWERIQADADASAVK